MFTERKNGTKRKLKFFWMLFESASSWSFDSLLTTLENLFLYLSFSPTASLTRKEAFNRRGFRGETSEKKLGFVQFSMDGLLDSEQGWAAARFSGFGSHLVCWKLWVRLATLQGGIGLGLLYVCCNVCYCMLLTRKGLLTLGWTWVFGIGKIKFTYQTPLMN